MNELFLKVILILSVGFTTCAVLRTCAAFVKMLHSKEKCTGGVVGYLLLFFAAIWCLRYAVGYYSIYCPNGYISAGLTEFEEIFNSIVHTFQSFSMDEDYTDYICAGKDMIKMLFPKSGWLVGAYGLYASVLNVFAPILGGAILLDILQGAFPKVNLLFKQMLIWKTDYYFSELNDSSLACAKSILKQKYHLFCRPVIVFADVYTDGENEKNSELLKKAKAIGGICIKDDMTHIGYRFSAKKEFWLIDENELDNIRELSELANSKCCKKLKRSIIRVFYQDDSYTLTESGIVNQIREKYKEKIFKTNTGGNYGILTKIKEIKSLKLLLESIEYENAANFAEKLKSLKDFEKCNCCLKKYIVYLFDRYLTIQESRGIIIGDTKKEYDDKIRKPIINQKVPAILRTRCYQDLIYNILQQYPLYQPLIGREKPMSLKVAILGNGSIGTEMFLSAYWCGQFYDIPLSINMVSMDEPDVATGKIDKISSEILESAKEDSPLLQVYPENSVIHNDPYFTFRYCKADVESADISSLECAVPLRTQTETVHNTQLLVDSDYFLVALGDDAKNIRTAERLYKAIAIRQARLKEYKNIVILYIVYDSHLCRALNMSFEKSEKVNRNIILQAIGSIDETYSFKSIIKEDYMRKKLNMDVESDRTRAFSHKDWANLSTMMSVSDKPYNFWSSYARDLHYNYKIFSVYAEKCKTMAELVELQKSKNEYICENIDENAVKLAWLEHRRWCAYMRSIGFKCGVTKDVKLLKTHKCLVEHHEPTVDEVLYRNEELYNPDLLELLKINGVDKNIIDYDYENIISDKAYKELKASSWNFFGKT